MFKYLILPFLIFLSGILQFTQEIKAQKIEMLGSNHKPILITPKKETGLSSIYVLANVEDVSMSIKSDYPDKVTVSTFNVLGAAFPSPVTNLNIEADGIIIHQIEGDSGYIIQDGDSTDYIWIIDYSKHIFNIESVTLSPDLNCDETILKIDGKGNPINYYTITGKKETLSREINIAYRNLEFDKETLQLEEKNISKNIDFIIENIVISPPILCTTNFTIKGDRFLSEWNEGKTYVSDNFAAIATMVYTSVKEENKPNDQLNPSNQIKSESEYFGGSAPSEISFFSYVSDAVVHNEWQMAEDESFDNITYRFNQPDLTYNFTSAGTTYVRFIGSNKDGSCESVSDVYVVEIGDSELHIPNAFSPNGDGINDIWKISYRSLLDFKCWIFDKQGHQIFFFDNPESGWDGRKNGKFVKSGVYYYVIQATGSDGEKYRKSGDINIIKSHRFYNNGSDHNN